jgi:uncharacterized protein
MLIEQLKSDNLTARKQGQTLTATLLTTLYAEAAMVGKNAGNRESTDDEVTAVIRKFLKNNLEAQAVIKDPARLEVLTAEAALLERYLPQMATEEDVRAFIAQHVAALPEKSPKAMGGLMAKLKEKFGTAYDAAKASGWVREALKP